MHNSTSCLWIEGLIGALSLIGTRWLHNTVALMVSLVLVSCLRGVAVDYFFLKGQVGIDVKQKGI